jgi:hypothetical protein
MRPEAPPREQPAIGETWIRSARRTRLNGGCTKQQVAELLEYVDANAEITTHSKNIEGRLNLALRQTDVLVRGSIVGQEVTTII